MENPVAESLRKRIFTRAALATLGTFALNSLGIWLSLYSIFWWYDMPMHFFGGLFTGLLVIVVFLRRQSFFEYSILKTSFIVLAAVLVIGVAWELYEHLFDIVAGRNQIILDSISDIFFDLAGGLQAVFVYLRHKKILFSKILA